MGQGPSVEELAKEDEAFRKYLDQIRGEIEGDLKADVAALLKKTEEYYEQGGWEYKPFAEADFLDIQQISSWSLTNVITILGSARDAIFGASAPPDGMTIEEPEGLGKAIGEMQDLKLLALNRAFGAIQGILQTFAVETSYRGQSIVKVEPLAPGLTLFLSIRSDMWKSKGFFDNKSIGQYLFVIRSYWSMEQAGDIGKFNSMMAYQELLTAWNQRIKALAEVIADPETLFSALNELVEEQGFYAEQVANIQAEIEALQKRDIEMHLSTARNALSMRQAALTTD